jgi:putative peptidoglycan lipid II flippase
MSERLLKSTVTVGGMTTLSRILGLIRDVVLARFIGAGFGADAFFVAFRIPNFLRRLFGEGAFSQAFVPVLSHYKTSRSPAEVKQLVDHATGWLGGILFLVSLVSVVAAPLLVMIFAPGFLDDTPKYDLTVQMLRITFPYILFISLTALAGGILNSYGNFAVPAFTPVLLNISMIATAIWLAPHMEQPVTALAWGVFIAGIAQLMFQLPYLHRLHLLPRPRFSGHDEGVGRIRKLMLPAIFGSSVAQINLLFDTLIASFLATGSVSWLYYSDRLVEFPLGVFGIAVATVILPSLSREHARASSEAFSHTLDWALRMVLIIGVPATVGLILLAGPLLITLFQYGEFDGHDVRMATLSLTAFAFGLVGFIMVKVLAPGFYAQENTRTPVRIGVIAMVSNMVLNIVFVVPMSMLGYEGPHAGLALATSLSALINATLLYRTLRLEGVYRPQPGWRKLGLQVLGANVLMGAMLWWGSGNVGEWMEWHGMVRIGHLAFWVLAGVAVYFAGLLLTGLRLRDLRR